MVSVIRISAAQTAALAPNAEIDDQQLLKGNDI